MYKRNDYVKFDGKVLRVNAINHNDATHCDDAYLYSIKDGSYVSTPETNLESASNLDITLCLLGIEKDVPFDIYNSDGMIRDMEYAPFIYDGNYIRDSEEDEHHSLLDFMLLHNLTAKPASLVGMTFSPHPEDKYYYISATGDVCTTFYAGSPFDLAFKLIGNMFETKKIAEANIDSIVAKYKEVM